MKKYEKAEKNFAGRNSYSKPDHDATFMHMKEDYMKNGQLKPGYNIQVATTDQYVVDYALFPNPIDFKTLEPFLDQMTMLDKFDKIVSDTGCGNEYNYSMLEEKYPDKKHFIPYTIYEKEQDRKYKNDPSKLSNWYYNEKDDYYIDHLGVRFNFKYYSQRQVRYNPNWQYLKEKTKKVLQSDEGKPIYGMRKYDVEPVFGHLKNVFGITHLRGKKKVETDVGIAFMMNINKFWNRR